jgi:glutathione synthase/RimK-type ligase-like ATP-grasp enzyme/glycosyltransferase involved in cell wall biosynthesis
MRRELVILNSSPYGNNADERSNRLLCEVAGWFGHASRVVAADRIAMAVSGAMFPTWPVGGVAVPRADLRSTSDLTQFAGLLRGLAAADAHCLVTAAGLMRAEDKLATHFALAARGIPSLPTVAIRASSEPGAELADAVAAVGGFPVVLKHPIGWGGMGVSVCRDLGTLRSMLTLADQLRPRETLMIQSFVPHRSSVTLLSVGGELVSSFRSYPAADEFRTNPRFGGRTEKIPGTPELARIAADALDSCGLSFGSVDCIEADHERLVVEVNSMPGLWPSERGDRRFAEALVRHAFDGDVRLPKILLVVPFPLEHARGNSVAARRLVRRLTAEGLEVEVAVVSGADDELAAIELVHRFDPTVVHVLQAWRCGPIAARIGAETGKPIVLSFRGTDAEEALDDPDRAPVIGAAVQRARVVTGLTAHQIERVRTRFPQMPTRAFVVPHGVDVQLVGNDVQSRLGLTGNHPTVVHVAGVRRVKGFPWAFEVVDALRERVPDLRYIMIGELLEADLAQPLAQFLATRSWAHHFAHLSHDDALALMATATATLHTSEREGLSNALLESLALGVPPIAYDIPATRVAVEHGVDGMLFQTPARAADALARLVAEPGMRAAISAVAQRKASDHFSEDAEFEGYLTAYRSALA